MTFFTDETLSFWRGLAADNSKAYFDANRKTYERVLKEPYQRLAASLTAGLSERHPEYQLDAKQATYRINRDLRFTADKSPYKTELGITIGRTQKHDPNYPGYTCRVGIDGVAMAAGLYHPDTALRDKVRRHVGIHSAELRALAAEPEFVRAYGEIVGDAHKRAPADLKDLAEVEPLVRNTQWVFWAGFEDPELLLHPDLDEFILDHWAITDPLMAFFKDAIAS